MNTPTVKVFYDDGQSWRAAKVNRGRGGWQAVVDHPAGAGFVSLRSSVTDPRRQRQRLTIIRAYVLT